MVNTTMTESGLERWARKQAARHGVLMYKFRSPTRRGVPDATLFFNGAAALVEFKSPKGTGKLSKLQEKEIAKLREHYLRVYVVNSPDQFNDVLVSMGVV